MVRVISSDSKKNYTLKQKKPIVEMGKRLCTLCREIYDFAEVTGRIDYNPVTGITKFLDKHEKQNMPHVSEKELPELLKKNNSVPKSNDRYWIGIECYVRYPPIRNETSCMGRI